jgi:hypothetical protein
MLSYPETDKAVYIANEHPLGEPIAELDAAIRSFREGLVMAVMYDLLSVEEAKVIAHHLQVADYYMAAGWAQMVEGRDPKDALTLGTKALEAARLTLTTIVEVGPKQTGTPL